MRLSPRERTLVYLREHIDQCDSEDRPAGWRIKIPKGAETQENACYQGAFVPFDIGKRHPEVLLLGMVYLGNDDEQQNLVLNPLQRRPSKGPIITALGVIEQIETGPRKQTVQQQTSKGCGCIFVFFIAVLGLAAEGLFF